MYDPDSRLQALARAVMEEPPAAANAAQDAATELWGPKRTKNRLPKGSEKVVKALQGFEFPGRGALMRLENEIPGNIIIGAVHAVFERGLKARFFVWKQLQKLELCTVVQKLKEQFGQAPAAAEVPAAPSKEMMDEDAGGVEVLVALPRMGTAAALGSLAANNAANQVSIVAAKAVEPLVALLREGSAGGKQAAARALQNLACYGLPAYALHPRHATPPQPGWQVFARATGTLFVERTH